jgi:rhodanese-related sulfurtransferase
MVNIEQILQFIQNHWALCAAFGAAVILLIFEEARNKISGIPKISAHTLTMLINRENAATIDLRNQKAFASGHIIDSINIIRSEFDANLKKIEPYKNQPVILVDEMDANAATIGTKLQKQGFTKIHILTGGIQAWKNAKLPLTKTT